MEAGEVLYSGTSLTTMVAYASDGIERWFIHANGTHRWARPCYSAAELAALTTSLTALPASSPGFEPLP